METVDRAAKSENDKLLRCGSAGQKKMRQGLPAVSAAYRQNLEEKNTERQATPSDGVESDLLDRGKSLGTQSQTVVFQFALRPALAKGSL